MIIGFRDHHHASHQAHYLEPDKCVLGNGHLCPSLLSWIFSCYLHPSSATLICDFPRLLGLIPETLLLHPLHNHN